MIRIPLRLVAAVMVAVFVGAACSGGGATVTADVTTTAPPTAAPPTTTTTTTIPPTTTTSTKTLPPRPTAPLTGLEVDAEITRPAFVLKIDNHEQARPQFGLNLADVVFEELVEGNITRLAAVFHSQDADPVGPVRSARTGDYDLLRNLNTPLFGNSGGNATVLRGLRNVDTIVLSDATVGAAAYYRVFSGRRAPHNLVTDTPTIYELAEDQGGTPPALFEYREDGDELSPTATEVSTVRVDYGGYRIEYTWDAEVSGWARTQQGTDHLDADEVRVAPENVVIQFIRYSSSVAFAGSPHAELIGSGDVWILTDGHLIAGTWSRAGETDVTTYADATGAPILLTPGRTWVALPKADGATIIE
ncbi:MAG: hypothetical protein ACI8Y4_002151 [Candidatus Poriferisodalaceae bacterium]